MNAKRAIIIFVSSATLIIVAGHAGLFFSWVSFFHIIPETIQALLGVLLGILSFSFLITSIVVYFKDTIITDALYTGSAVWLGFVWYVGLATVLTWILIGIQHNSSAQIPVPLIASVLLLAAASYTVFGVWNAYHPTIRTITLTIPNLPNQWKGKRIVQLSDIHLGPVHKAPFLSSIVQSTHALKPALVCITGDLFDGGGTKLDSLITPLHTLTSEYGTYFITGNHETYLGIEKTLQALTHAPITVLRDQAVTLDGLQLVGVDYPLPGETKNLSRALSVIKKNLPTIVLYHEPKFLDDFERAGVDLLLSGHTHKGQLWPFGYITKKIYKGHDYGLTQSGKLQVYTSPGIGTWGPPLRTGNRPEIVCIELR